MLMVRATPEAEQGAPPDVELMTQAPAELTQKEAELRATVEARQKRQ
jgi:hypothetical protein